MDEMEIKDGGEAHKPGRQGVWKPDVKQRTSVLKGPGNQCVLGIQSTAFPLFS